MAAISIWAGRLVPVFTSSHMVSGAIWLYGGWLAVGLVHAARQCLGVVSLGQDLLAALGGDDRGAGVLAIGSSTPPGRDVGVAQQVERTNRSLPYTLRVVEDRP